jgi:hypothetical protein
MVASWRFPRPVPVNAARRRLGLAALGQEELAVWTRVVTGAADRVAAGPTGERGNGARRGACPGAAYREDGVLRQLRASAARPSVVLGA